LGLIQLASFGLLEPAVAPFPFAPGLTNSEEVGDLALQEKQPCPQVPTKPAVFPPFQNVTEAQLAERVRDDLIRMIPHRISLLPDVDVDTPTKKYGLDLCTDVVKKNKKSYWRDWVDFMSWIRQRFGVTNELDVDGVAKSGAFSKVISFIISVLFRSMSESSCFVGTLTRICLLNASISTKFSLILLSRILSRLLEQMNERKIFSTFVIQFICERVREGWFSQQLVEPLSSMLAVCERANRTIPDCLLNLLLDAIPLVSETDLPPFLSLFVRYGKLIFSSDRIDFYVLLLDRMMTKSSVRPRAVATVLHAFVEQVQRNEDFHSKWIRTVIPVCPDCDLRLLCRGRD
jgi:hypothetical protein